MNRRGKTIVLLLSGCCAGGSLCGCAYTQSGDAASAPAKGYTWGNVFRKNIHSVAIPAFGTKAFSRGDEIAVTQALVAQIESRTPYKVVPQERADTVLEGLVVSVGTGTVSVDRFTTLPQEQLYTISVDFTWKDLRTGEILVERRNFEQSSTYYPTLGEGRFLGRQSTAESLAAAIVDELAGEW